VAQCEYEAREEYDAVWTLGKDWRRGMLVSGGDCRINCWELHTGAPHMHARIVFYYADCDPRAVPRLETCKYNITLSINVWYEELKPISVASARHGG
jgi:hypothetical protein